MNYITINSLDSLPLVVEWLDDQIRASGRRVVAFYAPMGAGKTTLISAYARSKGARQSPSSPTFAIINTYDTPSGVIYHFDLYRIDELAQAQDLALGEYFYDKTAISMVEWPEKIEPFLPENQTLRIKIELEKGEERKFSVMV